MTDLTGVKLARATARVVGKLTSTLPYARSDCYVPSTDNPPVERWRPDLGGAAAWEVLEWVRNHSTAAVDGEMCKNDVYFETYADGHLRCAIVSSLTDSSLADEAGPTDAIALCRAVVALGD